MWYVLSPSCFRSSIQRRIHADIVHSTLSINRLWRETVFTRATHEPTFTFPFSIRMASGKNQIGTINILVARSYTHRVNEIEMKNLQQNGPKKACVAISIFHKVYRESHGTRTLIDSHTLAASLSLTLYRLFHSHNMNFAKNGKFVSAKFAIASPTTHFPISISQPMW